MLKEKFFLEKYLSFSFGIVLCVKRIYVLDRNFYSRKIYHYLSHLIICIKQY